MGLVVLTLKMMFWSDLLMRDSQESGRVSSGYSMNESDAGGSTVTNLRQSFPPAGACCVILSSSLLYVLFNLIESSISSLGVLGFWGFGVVDILVL